MQSLKNTLPGKYSENVNYIQDEKGNYILDAVLLEKASTDSNPEEYNRLMDIAKFNEITDIKAWNNEPISYDKGTFTLGTFKDENGSKKLRAGYTLVSGKVDNPSENKDLSTSGNNEVYYLWLMNETSVASTLAHELYVHVWNYIKGTGYTHQDENINNQSEYFESKAKQNYEERKNEK